MTEFDKHQQPPETPADARRTELRALQDRFRRHILALNAGSMSNVPFDLSQVYPDTADIPVLVGQVDDLKRCLDSFRPFDSAQLKNIEETFDVEYTYESNRIEGNTLSLRETYLVVEKGMTVSGKPLKDHLEAVNHRDALNFMKGLAAGNQTLTERTVLDIHNFILSGIDWQNAGRYRTVPVRISGARHVPPNPVKVPQLMDDLFAYYDAARQTEHPVLLAANLHARLVNIHPFVDGNGRTARLVMNLILLQHGYVIANISGEPSERGAYYDALDAALVDGTATAFQRFILKTEKSGLIKYLDLMTPDVEHGKGSYFLERIKPYLGEPES